MSLLGLFDIGKSAIFASQTALNVVSNNIANVNTPGYSRHEVILEIANPVQIMDGFIGRGVNTAGIRRHYDNFLHLQILGQTESYGRSYALEQELSQVEQIFNEAKNLGLADPLKEYFNAWQEVATYPEGQPQRTTLLQKATTLAQTAKQMERDIQDNLRHINNDIASVVNHINTVTSNISALNDKIAQLEVGQGTDEASYFRDERDRQLNELAELMDYSWYEDDRGYVTILVGGKSLVNAEKAYELSTQLNLEGDRNVYLGGQEINSYFEKGQLGGFFAVRNDIKSNSLYDLRKLVASLIKETNNLHVTGYGLDGSTSNDFFGALQIYTRQYSSGAYVTSSIVSDPAALTLDEYDIRFVDAANYEVYNRQTGSVVTSGSYVAGGSISFDGVQVVIDGSPAANDSFYISPLSGVIENFNVAITDTQEIAAASSNADLPGDNTKALEIVGLTETAIADLNGATFEGYYSGIVSNVGIMSKAASDSLTYDDNLLNELQMKRDAVSGVSLDEEAANLIRFQRSFEAGAKILQVTDELMKMVLQL